MKWPLLREVRKIAVFRPNAVGDFVFCLPALYALRNTYREAEIVYLGREWHREFLTGRPGPVDRVVVVPDIPGIGIAADACAIACTAGPGTATTAAHSAVTAARKDRCTSNGSSVAGFLPSLHGPCWATGTAGAHVPDDTHAPCTSTSTTGGSLPDYTGTPCTSTSTTGGSLPEHTRTPCTSPSTTGGSLPDHTRAPCTSTSTTGGSLPASIDEPYGSPDAAGGCSPDYAGPSFMSTSTVRGSAASCPARTFIDEMRRTRFDIVFQMYGGGRFANPLVNSFGARLTVGMRSPDAAPLDRCIRYGGCVNRRLQLLEVAALAGARAAPAACPLMVTPADRLGAARILGVCSGRPLVVLQPGASDGRRRWSALRFAAVGDALAGMGADIVVNGTAQEEAIVRQVIRAMRHDAMNLSGRASLSSLCGVLERCALLVSNDTGPLHLALALDRPCVGIYWLTNLIESAPLIQENHRFAVSLRTTCPACGAENLTRRCEHNHSFVDDVPVDEVAALAIGMLKESG